MADWPTTLPKPLISGYQEGEPRLSIASQTDIGPPKVRKRATVGIAPITMQFIMTSDQIDIFQTFYRDTTAAGSLPFQMTHPRKGTTVNILFNPEQAPNWTALSANLFRVQFQAFEVVDSA